MANVTIKDVAIKAHVGVGTVSRVINGAPGVSKKTIDKVNKAIEETGFTPNALDKGYGSYRKSSILLNIDWRSWERIR